jgi:hypothetical protein
VESRRGCRLPALDRLDLIESGRLLTGSDASRRDLPRPPPSELIITGAQFALDYLAGVGSSAATRNARLGSMRLAGADAVEEIRIPELLVSRGIRRVTKVVLFQVRLRYTAMTGQVDTNGAAVEHYLRAREAPTPSLDDLAGWLNPIVAGWIEILPIHAGGALRRRHDGTRFGALSSTSGTPPR